MTTTIDFPIYDADNHMYETRDAFTKYLPPEYAGVVKYVEVQGRTKIAIKNAISDYIPNPTFDVVARPGAQQDYFQNGNPDGKSSPGDLRRADARRGGILRARAAAQAHG